jgi:DNA-binding CsgD family transcriptional regulator
MIRTLRRRHGIPAPGLRPGRWTEELVARLGKQSDASFARELGIDRSSVWAKRRSLGIRWWSPKRVWGQKELRWLGRLTDREIARRLGLSAETVGQKRRSLGIACSPSSGRGR